MKSRARTYSDYFKNNTSAAEDDDTPDALSDKNSNLKKVPGRLREQITDSVADKAKKARQKAIARRLKAGTN